MPAYELRNTEIRIQETGASEVYHLRVAEAAMSRQIIGSNAPRDAYGGILRHRQTAWNWQITVLHEMAPSAAKLLFIRSFGGILDPDTDPPSFTIEVTTPDGVLQRFEDARITSMTVSAEKRKIVAFETTFSARTAREPNTALVVTEPETPHRPLGGLEVKVNIDDVEKPCHAVSISISRQDGYAPANYDTNGEARGFSGGGRWDVICQLALPTEDYDVDIPIDRQKVVVDFEFVGELRIPTCFFMKSNQYLVADDFDDRILTGRAEVAPGENLFEIGI